MAVHKYASFLSWILLLFTQDFNTDQNDLIWYTFSRIFANRGILCLQGSAWVQRRTWTSLLLREISFLIFSMSLVCFTTVHVSLVLSVGTTFASPLGFQPDSHSNTNVEVVTELQVVVDLKKSISPCHEIHYLQAQCSVNENVPPPYFCWLCMTGETNHILDAFHIIRPFSPCSPYAFHLPHCSKWYGIIEPTLRQKKQ